jgi:hypothetical protein
MSPVLALCLVLVLLVVVQSRAPAKDPFAGTSPDLIHWLDTTYPDPTGIAPANIGTTTGGTIAGCATDCQGGKYGAFQCNGYNFQPQTKQCFLWNHPVPGSSSMDTHARLLASSHLACVAECKKSGGPDHWCNGAACSGSG